MHSPNPESLSLLAPGLLHQFGNLLLSVDGHARMLGGIDDRASAALRDVAARGSATLELLRWVVGGTAPVVVPVAIVLERLVEVARIGVRESEQRLELRHDGAVAASPTVDAAGTAVLVGEAIRRLLLGTPAGARGTVVVAWSAPCPGQAEVAVHFEPAAGTLPFPCAGEPLAAQLRGVVDGQGIAAACTGRAMGVALRFPAGVAPRAAEA